MAEKKPIIVVKKITIAAAGHHGGSWKVAFADFMTAMMAFFLVMWLISQNVEVKKNVADYFSTPSIIEYNFANYGVELTLEKLFLDLINEPLNVFQDFMTPVDSTPNFMAMGTKRIVLAHIAEELGDVAKGVDVNSDEILFEIPENILFMSGTAEPSGQFANIMDKVRGLTAGAEDSDIYVDSQVYYSQLKVTTPSFGKKVAEERLDLVTKKIQANLEHDTVDVFGRTSVEKGLRDGQGRPMPGSIKFKIKQKEHRSDGSKPRKFSEVFGTADRDSDVYQSFVKQLTQGRKAKLEKK